MAIKRIPDGFDGKRLFVYLPWGCRTLILGSSHVARLPTLSGMAKIAISGGGYENFKSYLEQKRDLIKGFSRILILDQGNDLKTKTGDNKEMVATAVKSCHELVRTIAQWFPGMTIVTTDILPRKLEGFTVFFVFFSISLWLSNMW